MVLNTPNAMILKNNIVLCCTQCMETSYMYVYFNYLCIET